MMPPSAAGSGELERSPPENSRDPLGIIGQTASHFQVKSYLAAGGMGVVYTAEDLQLGRTVALKFPLPHQQMDEAAKERFFREARSTAALDHPNLSTVYEVGESAQGVFMAMPLYKGETLRDRLTRERTLSAAEAIRITRELANGLASAHAAGIVHRDLKPGNVMLLLGGGVKILDFGIAKALDATLTQSRVTFGTIAYMAPEQIKSDRADARSDLWALGVMLHEMLGGNLPFAGGTEIAMLYSILDDAPTPPSVSDPPMPPKLRAVIAGLLQKDPSERYASAEALLADLDALDSGREPAHRVPIWNRHLPRKVRVPLIAAGSLVMISAMILMLIRTSQRASNDEAAAAAEVQRLAVLPFVGSTDNSAEEYLASGLTDELTASLGNTGSFRVTGRASAATLQRQGLTPDAIGKQLGVAYVVDGSLRMMSDTLLVGVQLSRVSDGASFWNHEFRKPAAQMSALVGEIGDSLQRVLLMRMRPPSLASRPTTDPEAYDLYLRARYARSQRTRANLELATSLYQAALQRDPSFAAAYAGIAEMNATMFNYGLLDDAALSNAKMAAERAVALDPASAEAHAALGFVQATAGAYREAEASLKHSIELNPSWSFTYQYYAILLVTLGRTREAEQQSRAVLSIDPIWSAPNAVLGAELSMQGRLQEARDQLQRAFDLDPRQPTAVTYLGAVEAALGNYARACEVLEKGLASSPDSPGIRSSLAYSYLKLGRAADSRRLVEDAKTAIKDEHTRVNYGLTLALLGPRDSAFSVLQTARWNPGTLFELRANPLLRDFRSDPRYPQLLARWGLKP
jgi:eukaryotic-like serine/threonine-protein kinase